MKKIIPSYARVVNETTGEVETVAVEIKDNIRHRVKNGWCRVYRFKLDDVLREITSKIEYDIFVEIRDSNISKTFALNFNQTKIAKKLNVSRMTVSRVVSKLKENDFIRKFENVYFINPFIYIPPNMPNEDIEKEQIKWSENKELLDDK